ncbi:DNA-binding transcription repressor [Linnemannia exigua]|uniref:DNA-binding transcription repressor n=1 Tax=Linnemannia exigua TaxID=604196 RepID=A0AAD4DJ51_9FUNG|nr:DNA-binding transcription repressor [Linnemannia exigua]
MSAQVSVPTMVAETDGRSRFSSASTSNGQSSKRMRVPLSSLQNMASAGRIPLTQREIESLQLKGVLRSSSTSSSSSTNHIQTSSNSSTSITPTSTTPRTATAIPPSPSSPQTISIDAPSPPPLASAYTFGTPSMATGHFSKPPLPIAARLAPLISSKPRNGMPAATLKTRKRGADAHLAIPYKERTLPSFHEGEIVDTCSHLQDGIQASQVGDDDRTGFRRHSDASTANRMPLPEDTLAYDPSRRASIATASPMIPSLLGNRRVLYKASYGLTLFSLPAKTPVPAATSHTEAMSSFKFPADASSGTVPLPSPSSPSAMSPGMFTTAGLGTPIRSKRKSSIPMRSPSWGEVQDGVIFSLPFGTPSLPTPPSRSASASCPSPMMQMATPPSPDRRSGLGIQVEETFTEPGATHPLEASPMMTSGSSSQPISFTDEDSTMSIGDIIIAEQEATAAHRAEAHAGGSQSQNQNQNHSQGMPTPPLTSRVPSLSVMEAEPDLEPITEDNASVPPTPVTPSRNFGSNANTERRQEASAEAQEDRRVKTTGQQDDRRGSGSPALTTADAQDQIDDSGVLPLWAQRQLSIRRQSAIPRPELDFVSGSGILPPASRGLKTVGGAKILSYPVLISDMVHVVLDDIQAKGGVLDGSDGTDESEEDSSEQQQQQPTPASVGRGGKVGGRGGKTAGAKRKRAGPGLKGRGAKASQAHGRPSPQEGEEPSGDEAVEEQEDRSRSGYTISLYNKRRQPDTPHHRDQQRQWHQLAPPVELTVIRSSAVRQNEDVDMDMDYDGGAATDGDDEDYYDDGSESAARQQQHHEFGTSQHKSHGRLQSVPEHLKIPLQEVDLAMQLSREMMETKKRKKQHKEKDGKRKKQRAMEDGDQDHDEATSSTKKGKSKGKQIIRNDHAGHHNNTDASLRRASLKTLKPLLDATLAVEEQDRKRFDAFDEDYNGEEDFCVADSVVVHYHGQGYTKQYVPGMFMGESISTMSMGSSGVVGSGAGKKSSKANGGASASGHSAPSSTGSSAGSGSGMNGGGSASPKKPAKARESKAATKKCEACGASETPCWRPGYTAHSALCNSCGLRYKKSNVFCAKVGCKYIPLKTEYAAMEAERVKSGRAHLVCHKCKGPVALPIIKE